NGKGDQLINDTNYNIGIDDFLIKEKEIILSIFQKFTFVVEVGCMHGRFLELALKENKTYMGIDNSSIYIEKGKKEYKKFIKKRNATLILGSSEKICEIKQIKN